MHFSRKKGTALVVVVLLTLVYAFQRDLYGLYLRYRNREANLSTERREVESLEQQRQQLEERIEALSTDAVEVEATIRRDRGLVREGETIFRIELSPEDRTDPEEGATREPDTRDPST